MKVLIVIAAAAFAAACASAEPAPAAGQSPAAASGAADYTTDARSVASDAEVRDARRAYRAACQQNQTDAYCECMTGGMAQMLAPADLTIATVALGDGSASASQASRERVEAAQAAVEPGCAQFRR